MRQKLPVICVVIGLSALALAAFCTPSLLLQPPVSDWNLMGRFPAFTSAEIKVARVILAFIGLGLGIGASAWMVSPTAVWRARIEEDYAAYSADWSTSPQALSKFIKLWLAVTGLVMLLLIQSLHWSHAYYGKAVLWYDVLTQESGVFETLTAVMLFIAGVLFVFSAIKFRNIFGLSIAKWPALILGILLIVGAGEEISWGQHWFHFATPESLKAVNDQNEFNLHNISTHWTNHLMVLFFLSYVGVMPLAALFSREIRYVVQRLNVPLCPLAFVPFAFIGLSMSEAFPNVWGNPLWSPNEARETLFGLIMMGIAVSFFLIWEGRAPKASRLQFTK